MSGTQSDRDCGNRMSCAIARRQALGALLATVLPAVAGRAFATGYPDRPVKVVVPWPAGGLVDIPARLLAEKLQPALGQPVVVENKTGAGGTIGADAVAKSAPDGQTLVVTTSAVAINEAMQAKLPFDLMRDLQPVAAISHAPLILVVHPEKGPRSVAELVARARRQPGRLSYASAGKGSPGHLAGEWLRAREKVDVVHVAYKGAPPAMIDQMAGLVDFHFANAAVGLPQIRAGKIRPLAVASASRMPQLPDVPTMAEAGLAGFDTDQWIGMLAPRGTPAEVVERLNKLVVQALSAPEARATIERNGMTVAAPATPARFTEEVRRDLQKWTAIVRSADIKPE